MGKAGTLFAINNRICKEQPKMENIFADAQIHEYSLNQIL
jgi:hypothetical protein